MYFDYLTSRLPEYSVIKEENGFCVYKEVVFNGDKAMYIQDIYVKPNHRSTYLASSMADKVAYEAREQGITKLLGSVVPTANQSTASIQVLLNYGMNVVLSENDIIYFIKDI